MSTMTLEPCPFCGMSVEYVTRPVSYGREFWYVYHPEHPRGECILEDQKFSSASGWNCRANLAQPAQAVDVEAIREVIDDLREWGKSDMQLAMRAATLARALSGEKAGPADGIAMAAAYIQKKADDYAAENCGTEWDTGATTYRYGQAGEDYHHTLLELAEEIAALPASPAPDKECQP